MEEIRFEYDCDVSVPHFHNELEILYVLSGRMGVMLAGSNYLLKQEDFSVFNPFEIHEMYREAGCHTLPLSSRSTCCSIVYLARFPAAAPCCRSRTHI